MAYKRINIGTTDEFERKVAKFIHSQYLKGKETNRSELDRNAIEFFIANEKRKKKINKGD